MSGQVWRHTLEQRVAASTLRRYSFGLRLTIAQADARPVMSIPFMITGLPGPDHGKVRVSLIKIARALLPVSHLGVRVATL